MEETPSQYRNVEDEPEPTGNTASCYLCGLSFSKIKPEYVIRRDYEYNVAGKKERAHMRRYFMSFCLWCAHSYKL